MNTEQILSALTLQANLQSTITHLLAENAELVERLGHPCPDCAAAESRRIAEEGERAAADLDAQRNRNRDESNAI